MSRPYLLAADIGGSHSRMRISSLGENARTETVGEIIERSARDVDQLKANLKKFVEKYLPESGRLQAAVLGLPGKISLDRRACAVTYVDPDTFIPFDDLFEELDVKRGALANDLECGMWGLEATRPHQIVRLCGSEAAGERRILGMPGTGLGIGIALSPRHSLSSEGGHLPAALDPDDGVERRFFEQTRVEEFRDVPTYEDLLRGSAIPRLFRCVAESNVDAPPDTVSAWAGDPGHANHRVARKTFEVYGRFLGRSMQSIALLVLAEAVFLGGVIVAANHRHFTDSFKQSFQTHAVHGQLLCALPVRVVTNLDLNLDGATRRAATIDLLKTC